MRAMCRPCVASTAAGRLEGVHYGAASLCRVQIYEHKVDNVIMGDPPMQRLPMLVTLNLSPPVRQPYPTPWQSADSAP